MTPLDVAAIALPVTVEIALQLVRRRRARKAGEQSPAQPDVVEEFPAEAPDTRKRRKFVAPGQKKALDFTDGGADLRGLNSGATSAAEYQLAAALAAAHIQPRDYGEEPDEQRTLITTSFGTFFLEDGDFPARIRKRWPDLSDDAVSRACKHLCDIVKIDRMTTLAQAKAAEKQRRPHHRTQYL